MCQALSSTELALTVLEMERGEFHWILLEPAEAGDEDIMRFRPVDSSPHGYDSYQTALAHGSIAMRKRVTASD